MLKKLYEVTQILSRTAMGILKADTVIINAKLINVCTREIQENVSIAIKEGRIVLVGDATHTIGENTEVIDAKMQYVSPGFIDAHVHVESSMLTVTEYSKASMPHGTTAIFMDPHEITNVLGLDGLKLIMEDAKNTPLKALTTTPSCVPSVTEFEDNACTLTPGDIKKTMTFEDVIGLGEMMNYPAVINGGQKEHQILSDTLKANKIITGHYPVVGSKKELSAYITAGIKCDHETTTAEDALNKLRLGMYVLIRQGSAWQDLKTVIKAITENKIDSRFACLVTDDTHPHTLIEHGHMDYLLKLAVEYGVDPIEAIQMVTINPATCFKLEDEFGSITPGKCADIIFLDNLKDFKVTRTIINGETIAIDGKLVIKLDDFIYPELAKNTMKIDSDFAPTDFKIQANTNKDKVNCYVIEAIESNALNRKIIMEMNVCNKEIISDITKDVLKAFVVDRHHNNKNRSYGLIKGFGIKEGAIASTVSHDAHNLLIVGTNDEDMALCANTLKNSGGGMVVCSKGKVLGLMPLPIAGLMCQKTVIDAANTIDEVAKAYDQIGCTIQSPFMTMALMALCVIPELRLTNKGLIDCETFKFVDLIC